MKTNYWNSFYKKKMKITFPSNYALYVYKKYLKNTKLNILDIGCGNGRDSFFFAKKNFNVTAIDSSYSAINFNKKKKKINKFNNLDFKLIDINDQKFSKLGNYYYIYSRFFLHTINEKSENNLLRSIKKISIPNKSLIMLEFRTIKDPLLKKGKKISINENIIDHYRRFIDTKQLKRKITKNNFFKIIYFIEKRGLAKFKNENPTICRLILKRTNKK